MAQIFLLIRSLPYEALIRIPFNRSMLIVGLLLRHGSTHRFDQNVLQAESVRLHGLNEQSLATEEVDHRVYLRGFLTGQNNKVAVHGRVEGGQLAPNRLRVS